MLLLAAWLAVVQYPASGGRNSGDSSPSSIVSRDADDL
jgi:hypothetical protein